MIKHLKKEETLAIYDELFSLPNKTRYVEQDWVSNPTEELNAEISEEDDKRTSIFQMINDDKEFFRQNYFNNTGENTSDVIRAAKRLVWGKSKMENNYLPALIDVFRYVVEDIYAKHFTPETYFSNWCSKLNRAMGLEGLILQIANAVPDSIKTECCFDQKRIVLRVTYPELYEKSKQEIDALDIWNAKGEIKAGLIRNAKVDLQDAGIANGASNSESSDKKPGKAYGGMVDKIVYDAITEVFKGFDYNIEAALEWCSNWQRNNSGGKEPGFLSVIKARGCYAHLIDFYFLNSPPMAQFRYFDLYLELRDAADISSNAFLEGMKKTLKDKDNYESVARAVANETRAEFFDDPFYIPRGDFKISSIDFEKNTDSEREEDAYEAG